MRDQLKSAFVTHCDESFLIYAERLFDSMQIHCPNQTMLFYSIGFEYTPKHRNIKSIYVNTESIISDNDNKKANLVFLKPLILEKCIKEFDAEVFCYVDADCLFTEHSSKVFQFKKDISDYPLIYRGVRDFMILNGQGDPHLDGRIDYSRTLEGPLMSRIGLPSDLRGKYGQTGVILFNAACGAFVERWKNACNLPCIKSDQVLYAPFHEETVINCLLWKENKDKKLPQVLVNIPYDVNGTPESDIKLISFIESLNNPEEKETYLSTFCRIPARCDVENVMFLHGKLSENQYSLLNLLRNKKKILFITGHCSSGGGPKYVAYLIKKFINIGFEVEVIEWNIYSLDYVVHRNEIINLVGQESFHSIGFHYENDEEFYSKIPKAKQIIENFAPDIIHLNDPAERFAAKGFNKEFADYLYRADRSYFIAECIHDSAFDIASKKYIPNEFWFCSDFYSSKTNVPSRVVEMELPKRSRPDRKEALQKLNLDFSYFYCLQVGLFSEWKNQEWTFKLAERFLNKKIKWLFLGNTCFYDRLNLKKPDNCIILGEVSNVEDYYSSCDLFLLPSKAELNPLSIKEAISFGMRCFVSELPSYREKYINTEEVRFIKGDNVYDYLQKVSSDMKQNEIAWPELVEKNSINFCFKDGPRVEVLGPEVCSYLVEFFDRKTGHLAFSGQISNNMWIKCNIRYYVDWLITVTNLTTTQKTSKVFDLKGLKVKIINESSSLGDSIAWFAAIEAFQKKNDCFVDYFSNRGGLFAPESSKIQLKKYDSKDQNSDYAATYSIGTFQKGDRSPVEWNTVSLDALPCHILGIEKPATKPNIRKKTNSTWFNGNYVCIASMSTLQNRFWNNPNGWQSVVKHLHILGYKVVCLDKNRSFGSGAAMNQVPQTDLFAGDMDFNEIVSLLNGSKMFIGLSSGLSWLSWALNVPSITISGAVEPFYEFENKYRVQSDYKCTGCFNKTKFDPSNWLLCEHEAKFECTKQISSGRVIAMIDQVIKDLNISS